MSTTLVKNGTVVTASDRYQADIYIDKGQITLIGQGLNRAQAVLHDGGDLKRAYSGGHTCSLFGAAVRAGFIGSDGARQS